jgi:hypothetical protein
MKIFLKIYLCSVPVTFVNLFPFHLDTKEVSSLAQKGESVNRFDVAKFFQPTVVNFNHEKIVTDPKTLRKAAKVALNYFQKNKGLNAEITRPHIFSSQLVSPKQVEQTLQFIISTIEQDMGKNNFRILDTNFLARNFKFIKWNGDVLSARKNNVLVQKDGLTWVNIPQNKIRLTKYAIFNFNGSYNRTRKFSYPLYQIIDKKFVEKDRFLYTKQNVLAGALNTLPNRKKVKPLVWLSREDMDDAMMQGTVQVRLPDGKKRIFAIDLNNGIAYDKRIKELKKQKRFWYFKEIKSGNLKGTILEHGGAVFAGDLINIGLGKIIAIKYKNLVNGRNEIRLGVLGDLGGAFANNLYQLDLFAGVFRTKDAFKSWIKGIPDAVQAYVMVKR